MKNDKNFEISKFRSPDLGYAPVYGWMWNGQLSDERIEEQILEMKRLGIRAFYIIPEPQRFRPASIPTLMEPDYLTDAYFCRYKFAMEKARELGMECWLYDEGGWPSGGACGMVLIEHPEYARRVLAFRNVTVKAGESYTMTENTAAAFINGDEMIQNGAVFSSDTEVTEYYSKRDAWSVPGKPEYPDITMLGATREFIKMTHEKYKPYLSELFGSTITMVFTDEPTGPELPFREELCEIYEKEYGESILPYLPILRGNVPATAENNRPLMRWYDICSRMFSENFLGECKKWSNENGLLFTGHLNCEDEPKGCMRGKSYHVMRALRVMDVPGIAVIWRQIFPGKQRRMLNKSGTTSYSTAENRFFPRYASSAAAQNGTDTAMTETYGVYGSGLTYDQMRFVAGFQTIRGVTLINPMTVSYARKAFMLTGEHPTFAENQACHRDLGVFNAYLERLSYVCTRGERVCDTALYYPVNDFWGMANADNAAEEFDRLGFAMEANGVDFDIFDDDIVSMAEDIDSGVIKVGKAVYRKLVIPSCAYIPEKTAEQLKRFENGGGKIFHTSDGIKSEVRILSDTAEIRTMKRVTDSGEMLILFNESTEKRTVKLSVGSEKGYIIDITAGELYDLETVSDTASVTLESGETTAVYLTNESLDSRPIPEYSDLCGPTDFTFRRIESYVIGDVYAENHTIEESPIPVKLGDWSYITGRDFSGSCIYTTTFAGTDTDTILDLGEVRYSCEAILNGRSLGVKVMKPYRFDIPKEYMTDGENKLEIRVSNTPGNQHQFTKSFDNWGSWQHTPYRDRQDIFDSETLDSGLYGPVKLFEVR